MEGQPDTMASILASFPDSLVVLPPSAAAAQKISLPRLQTMSYAPQRYRQAFAGFAPGVTALDLLFNHGEDSRAILKQSITITKQ